MKKLSFIILALVSVVAVSCDKDKDNVSMEKKVSRPTITVSGNPFYSIKVGDPLPTITATAYDSVLKESTPVEIVGAESLDNTTPGLSVLTLRSTNSLGFYSEKGVLVAVTNVAESIDLSGEYLRAATSATAVVEELANGLYSTDNLFGSPSLFVTAYFVHVDDTTIIMPDQATELGDLVTADASLKMAPGDTTISYKIMTLTTNNALRTFKKQ